MSSWPETGKYRRLSLLREVILTARAQRGQKASTAYGQITPFRTSPSKGTYLPVTKQAPAGANFYESKEIIYV